MSAEMCFMRHTHTAGFALFLPQKKGDRGAKRIIEFTSIRA